jgi:hypothetical protein
MYLDIDNVPFIDLKRFPFVVAYWKSLSNNGYGILIKYKKDSNLNLLDCVKELSSLFNLELDVNAVSVDRLNVLSYDKNIYFNPNYEEYIFSTNSKVVSVSYNNTTVYRLEATDTANVDRKIRFSNLDEIVKSFDFNGEAFIDLGDDKIEYAEVFVPKEVFKGNRNKAMFVLCSQLRGLNTWLSFDLLYSICNDLNISKFKPFLSDAELLTIVRKVYNNKKPMVVLNKTKRILFNPDYEISGTEKRKMSAIAIRVAQGKKNTNKLFETINNWDFEKNGVISQSKLAKETGFGIATVKRRAKQFKTIIEEINKDYVNSK